MLDYHLTKCAAKFPWSDYKTKDFVVQGLPHDVEPCRPEHLPNTIGTKDALAVEVIKAFHRGEVRVVR